MFTLTNSDPLPNKRQMVDESLLSINVNRDEVVKCLHNLNISKATGPDGIPTQVLKEFAKLLAHPLARVFYYIKHRYCPERMEICKCCASL